MSTFDNLNKMTSRIQKMTFGELRNELANSDDPVKKEIIRNLMYIRYNQHIAKKEKINQLKKENRKQQIHKIKKKVEDKYKSNTNDTLDLDIDDLFEQEKKKEKHIVLDEEPEEITYTQQTTPQIKEYNRDKTNNNLMKRLSNDIDINKIKDDHIYSNRRKDISRDFVPPFANNLDEQYASFSDAFTAPTLPKKHN